MDEQETKWNDRLPADAEGVMRLWPSGQYAFHATTCGALHSHEQTNPLPLIPIPLEWLHAKYLRDGPHSLCATDVGHCLLRVVHDAH